MVQVSTPFIVLTKLGIEQLKYFFGIVALALGLPIVVNAEPKPLTQQQREVAASFQQQAGCDRLESFLREYIEDENVSRGIFVAMSDQLVEHLKTCSQLDHGYSHYVLGLSLIVGAPQNYISYPEAADRFLSAAYAGSIEGGQAGLFLLFNGPEAERHKVDRRKVIKIIDALESNGVEVSGLRSSVNELFFVFDERAELAAERSELDAEHVELCTEARSRLAPARSDPVLFSKLKIDLAELFESCAAIGVSLD